MLAGLQAEPVALPRSGYTVLVVDDEAAVRSVAVRLLRRSGYNVLEASNASETRKFGDIISKGGVDLVLTDVVMKRGMDPEYYRVMRGWLAAHNLL